MMSSAADIDENKLTQYLSTHLSGFKGPLKTKKFSGGQSNPTFLIEAASGQYVLRRKPPGELLKSAHAVDREFRVIQALHNTEVPVASAYLLCEDSSVIGTMFYIMEYIEGRVFWNPALSALDKSSRAEIYNEMNSVLARLHSVDIEKVGLADYGRAGNYYERQTSRWIKQYRASEIDVIADMDALIEWLSTNTPEDDGRVCLVHGDYRLDNMIFAKNSNKVLALVDWELSTLGHPFSDLAYQCMQWRLQQGSPIPGLADLNRKQLGIPSEEEYVAQYCERMGIGAIPSWNYYVAFSAFRFAAILQGVKKRAVDGNASSDKAFQMGEMVAPLAKIAVDIIS